MRRRMDNPINSEKKKPAKSKLSTPKPAASRLGSQRKYDRYTPLKLEPAEVLQVVIDHLEMRLTYSHSRGPLRPNSDRFWHFYNEYGHDTNSCFHLKDKIERIIIQVDRQSPRGQKRKEPEMKHEDKGKAPQTNHKSSSQ
ncbi:hypothetical protein ACS0TY_033576 [Phlomoides rotata]